MIKNPFIFSVFLAFMLGKITALTMKLDKESEQDFLSFIIDPVDKLLHQIGIGYLKPLPLFNLGSGFEGTSHLINYLITYIPVFFLVIWLINLIINKMFNFSSNENKVNYINDTDSIPYHMRYLLEDVEDVNRNFDGYRVVNEKKLDNEFHQTTYLKLPPFLEKIRFYITDFKELRNKNKKYKQLEKGIFQTKKQEYILLTEDENIKLNKRLDTISYILLFIIYILFCIIAFRLPTITSIFLMLFFIYMYLEKN